MKKLSKLLLAISFAVSMATSAFAVNASETRPRSSRLPGSLRRQRLGSGWTCMLREREAGPPQFHLPRGDDF